MVVDPGDATPVIATLLQQKLTLCGILITHHHWDHTGGIPELMLYQHQKHPEIPLPIYGYYHEPVPHITHPLKDNEVLILDTIGISFQIIYIPGHTLGHIAYYGDNQLFCGDTLFTAGCGRLFEGTAEQMYQSLSRIKELPEDTLIYCGHEYTEANLRFALMVEPQNSEIVKRMEHVQSLRAQHKPTVPSTLGLELQTNPFLRTNHPEVKHSAESYIGHPLSTEPETLATLRLWKNQL